MNTSDPEDAQSDASNRTPAGGSGLPVLTDARIDDIEKSLFADIARERSQTAELVQRRGRTRRRVWTGVGAAAAVIVVAAVISPMVLTSVSGSSSSAGSSAVGPVAVPGIGTDVSRGGAEAGTDSSSADIAGGDSSSLPAAGSDQSRQVIASGSATVAVDDVRGAVSRIGQAAVASGGYVESLTIGESGVITPLPDVGYDTLPPSVPTDGGWITVRVPSDQLTPLIEGLADTGEVTASSIGRQDVTDQSIDLQARITAAEASVSRLTDLMAQATSVADLLAAESALSERQGTLESYQQQLEYLQGQVEFSSLTVTVVPTTEAVTADPAGFGDGLAAGWNGLVATLNAIVVSLGFLLPWIIVIAVIGGIVWVIVSAARRGRAHRRERARSDEAGPTAQ